MRACNCALQMRETAIDITVLNEDVSENPLANTAIGTAEPIRLQQFRYQRAGIEVLANVLKQFDSKNLDTRPVDSGAAHARERI